MLMWLPIYKQNCNINHPAGQQACTARQLAIYVPDLTLTNTVEPEPEGSSPHSQQPANGPYPEPGESTPHPPNQSP
jgi:hypothetical protein